MVKKRQSTLNLRSDEDVRRSKTQEEEIFKRLMAWLTEPEMKDLEKEYLTGSLREVEEDLAAVETRVGELLGDPKNLLTLNLLQARRILPMEREILKKKARLYDLAQPRRSPVQRWRVSPTEIERAGAYPMEVLLEVGRAKLVRCPFHKQGQEKHPSMRVKENRAFCFVCQEGFDPIALVMKRDGLTFREAVRRLSGS